MANKSKKKAQKKSAKKKAAKKEIKKSIKKAVKKSVKKATKKVASKKSSESKIKPLSIRCCELILEGHEFVRITEILNKEYGQYKYNTVGTVKYYLRFIRLGKMEKAGFAYDQVPQKAKDQAENKTTKKQATRKVATRKK